MKDEHVMKIAYFQKGFNYSQDGPGNRLVYHLCGCNLSCPWCANPEGLEAVSKETKITDTDSMMKEAWSARPMFFDCGGVTFTGGEPTLQFDSLKDVLRKLHDKGINTCIETNGTSSRLQELFPFLSILIMDCKQTNTEKHKQWTGLGNDQIITNLTLASKTNLPLQIRIPLIHGVNDDENSLTGFIRLFSMINRENLNIEFLPYHEYGKEKWLSHGLKYQMKDAFVSMESIQHFEHECKNHGLHVIHT